MTRLFTLPSVLERFQLSTMAGPRQHRELVGAVTAELNAAADDRRGRPTGAFRRCRADARLLFPDEEAFSAQRTPFYAHRRRTISGMLTSIFGHQGRPVPMQEPHKYSGAFQ